MSPAGGKTPEQLARENIDAALAEAGWTLQDSEAMNVGAGFGVAIREFKTDAGFAEEIADDLRSALEQIEEILGDLRGSGNG